MAIVHNKRSAWEHPYILRTLIAHTDLKADIGQAARNSKSSIYFQIRHFPLVTHYICYYYDEINCEINGEHCDASS